MDSQLYFGESLREWILIEFMTLPEFHLETNILSYSYLFLLFSKVLSFHGVRKRLIGGVLCLQ